MLVNRGFLDGNYCVNNTKKLLTLYIKFFYQSVNFISIKSWVHIFGPFATQNKFSCNPHLILDFISKPAVQENLHSGRTDVEQERIALACEGCHLFQKITPCTKEKIQNHPHQSQLEHGQADRNRTGEKLSQNNHIKKLVAVFSETERNVLTEKRTGSMQT
jgi:hypothetical protein